MTSPLQNSWVTSSPCRLLKWTPRRWRPSVAGLCPGPSGSYSTSWDLPAFTNNSFQAIQYKYLYDLRRTTKFVLTSRDHLPFEQLKTAFTTAHIQAHPDPAQELIMEANSFNVAIEAILSPRFGPQQVLQLCTYFSQNLTSTECNYEILNKELLAIKLAFKNWHHFTMAWLQLFGATPRPEAVGSCRPSTYHGGCSQAHHT